MVGEEASAVLARTKLAVKVTISAARFVKGGLPFQGSKGEYSQYNPPLRLLLSEKTDARAGIDESVKPEVTATLVARDELSPSVSRFTFKLGSARGDATLPKWQPGQHITLDFEPELGFGYAHMRDEDPQSINDDFVRTFTVSSPPNWQDGKQLQITARRHGPATGLLWKHNLRVELEIPVLGFGGEEKFRLPTGEGMAKGGLVFIAGGVGITPVLAQAKGVLDAGIDLKLIWSIRGEDLPLVADTFRNIPGLAAVTTLYVTGEAADLQQVSDAGVQSIQTKRIGENDVNGLKGHGRQFFLCAGPALLQRLTAWLGDEDVVWEDFGY